MILRWVWRTLAIFLGRKAWEAYQRRRAPRHAGARAD
jgi:hypothetical protein